MVTSLNPSLSIYNINNDNKYSGVVKVSTNGYYGSGVLLYDGSAILTAAHIFSQDTSDISIRFDSLLGTSTLTSSNVTIMPEYESVNGNNDLAIVWLDDNASKDIQRYDLYRDADEINQDFEAVGFGVPGTGSTGESSSTYELLRLKSSNTFDVLAGDLKDALGYLMAWEPQESTILVADFDDGSSAHDALGQLMSINNLGTGYSEGLISPGDSGGPAFIDQKVAGIASYTSSLSAASVHPDVDESTNSSFGELGFWHRVSSYQQWIDESIRSHYTNTPTRVEEVVKVIQEGDTNDISTVYFFLEVHGTRNEADILSVLYATRDGSANEYTDYIPTHGQLMVYPNESYVLIPVEIIGDDDDEGDETFYLDVFEPIGAHFENDQVQLTAQRTIIDDDAFLI